MEMIEKTRLLLVAAPATLLLAACAVAPSNEPFDRTAGVAGQADSYIQVNGGNAMKQVGRVAVTSCNVLFAQTSEASASTSPGIFDTRRRAEAQVAVTYSMEGLDDAQMRRMTEDFCAAAERDLAAAGYDVVPHAEVVAKPAYAKLAAAGKPTPAGFSAGASEYIVYARGGANVFDDRYQNVGGQLANAFKSAGGDSVLFHRGAIVEQVDATAVEVNLLVDFAAVAGNNTKGFLGKLGGSDTASVAHAVQLSASGDLTFFPRDALKCWERFGNHECNVSSRATYRSKRAIVVDEPFYREVRNDTTTGDVVTAGVTKALSILAGTTSYSRSRFAVVIDPAQFQAAAAVATDSFVQMAAQRARADGP